MLLDFILRTTPIILRILTIHEHLHKAHLHGMFMISHKEVILYSLKSKKVLLSSLRRIHNHGFNARYVENWDILLINVSSKGIFQQISHPNLACLLHTWPQPLVILLKMFGCKTQGIFITLPTQRTISITQHTTMFLNLLEQVMALLSYVIIIVLSFLSHQTMETFCNYLTYCTHLMYLAIQFL